MPDLDYPDAELARAALGGARAVVLPVPGLLLALATAGTLACFAVACGDEPRSTPRGDDGPGGRVQFPGCQFELGEVTVGLIEGTTWWPSPSFALDGDTLLVHRRGTTASNSPHDLELVAVVPATGEARQITTNGVDDTLLDARDGAVLFATRSGDVGELVLERAGRREVLQTGALPSPLYAERRPIRLLSHDAAGWLTYDTTDTPGRYQPTVRMYVDGVTHVLSDGLDGSQVPDVQGREAVWIGTVTSQPDVYYATVVEGGVQRRRITDDPALDRDPMLGGSAIFWLADGVPTRHDLRTGETAVLGELTCTDLAVDGVLAVFTCTEEPLEGWWPPRGTTLWLWDGATLERLVQPEEPIFEVALAAEAPGGPMVAFVTYGEPEAGAFQLGTIWLLRIGDPRRVPLELAAIGSGCWFCDSLWPPVVVRVQGALMAWNYAVAADEELEPWEMPEAIGYALLGEGLVCGESPR
jgi:hypothetical protein